MKLFAQHGHADGKKTSRGLEDGLIDGVIFGPKDISQQNLSDVLADMSDQHPHAARLFDPQVYASFLATVADSRMGYLIEQYGQPAHYFAARRRSQFESEAVVREQILRTLKFEQSLPVTAVIAPNIYIPSSCNSIEAVISKHFLRQAKGVAREIGEEREVYATLALSREAILNRADFVDFLSDITVLDDPPDGFYLLIGGASPDARQEFFHSDVVAGWMLINRTLSENGFKVINGYSDLMSPVLGVAGAHAGACGWWSNLRGFSLERFAPPVGGGSLPTVRYLSCAMLGRITYFELAQLREIFPDVLNDLPTDIYYPENDEPDRRDEVLQTWDALNALNRSIAIGSISEGLSAGRAAIARAIELRNQIRLTALRLETKSDGSHLEPLGVGLARFAELAELG
jgi:hypothetical protein